jgi:signal transduction histidine kinase
VTPISFRARILLTVLGVGVAPLALLGLWLSGTAARSGEAILRDRLTETLDRNAAAIELAWIARRTALLDLADLGDDDTRRTAFPDLDPAIQEVVFRDTTGIESLRLDRPPEARSAAALAGPSLSVVVPLHHIATGRRTGTLEAVLPLHALHDRVVGSAAGAGVVLTAFEPGTGVLLRPVPFDAALLDAHRFAWAGDEWLTARRAVVEPRLELAAAAALGPYTAPVRDVARRGLLVLLGVVLAGTALAAALADRLTASLGRLAVAAGAVARGDLDRRVEPAGPPEVARVAAAFNTMTANLRRTLGRLAERESLVAVNEFAAALAHEVRNPLSSIQLDLQEVEEGLPDGSPLRDLQLQALDDLRRLDRTVAAALGTARAGVVRPRGCDLLDPVRAAIRAAAPRLAERRATLDAPADDAVKVPVHGDPDALERVVLNLLLNAADAAGAGGAGGQVQVRVEARAESAVVVVRDDGAGMAPAELARVFEPFYSTRAGGTGVGLTIARRIVAAHGGTLHLDSAPGEGTTAQVTLPVERSGAAGGTDPERTVPAGRRETAG